MISKKKSLLRIPANIVQEKTRLLQLKSVAHSSNNRTEEERLEEQLDQLEELAQGTRIKAVSRENEMFWKVNERNRRINMTEMREAERRGADERRRTGMCPSDLLAQLSSVG
jgi:hypothetical protein